MEGLRIPPIDPYVVDSQTMTVRRGESFTATGTVRKVHIYGASKAKILDVKYVKLSFRLIGRNFLNSWHFQNKNQQEPH